MAKIYFLLCLREILGSITLASSVHHAQPTLDTTTMVLIQTSKHARQAEISAGRVLLLHTERQHSFAMKLIKSTRIRPRPHHEYDTQFDLASVPTLI